MLVLVVVLQLHQRLEVGVLVGETQISNKIENLFAGKNQHSLFLEEEVDVLDVPFQKLQRVRVVVLHGVGHVDHYDLALVIKQVVLR